MQPDDFPEIDTQTASVARAYDYMLGGTANYEVDRRAADMGEDMLPGSYALARNNRRYLERVVHYLAAECGIRQFIDNGSGLPTQNNVHQVAQKAGPGSRVVYVDIDPVVLAHGRVKALLAEDNSTAFIEADASDVDCILSHPDTRRLINFDEPVAALYISFLHCIPDARDPRGVVRQMTDHLAPGSYVAVSHITSDDPQVRERVTRFTLEATGGHWGRVRSREEVAGFFDGLEIVPPGLAKVTEWHPDGREEKDSPEWFEYGGVARKPLCNLPAPRALREVGKRTASQSLAQRARIAPTRTRRRARPPPGLGPPPRLRLVPPRRTMLAAGSLGQPALAAHADLRRWADLGGRHAGRCQTWTAVPQGPHFTQLGVTIDFVSQRTGFAWILGGDTQGPLPPPMYQTTNSGRTWKSFTPRLES
jgi:hypothetical protein